jgi:hypothetical protein
MGVDRVVLFRLATSERLERAVKALPGGEAGAWRASRPQPSEWPRTTCPSRLPCHCLPQTLGCRWI